MKRYAILLSDVVLIVRYESRIDDFPFMRFGNTLVIRISTLVTFSFFFSKRFIAHVVMIKIKIKVVSNFRV